MNLGHSHSNLPSPSLAALMAGSADGQKLPPPTRHSATSPPPGHLLRARRDHAPVPLSQWDLPADPQGRRLGRAWAVQGHRWWRCLWGRRSGQAWMAQGRRWRRRWGRWLSWAWATRGCAARSPRLLLHGGPSESISADWQCAQTRPKEGAAVTEARSGGTLT